MAGSTSYENVEGHLDGWPFVCVRQLAATDALPGCFHAMGNGVSRPDVVKEKHKAAGRLLLDGFAASRRR